jgi:hypothetical protein
VNGSGDGPDSAPAALPPSPLSHNTWKEGELITGTQIDWHSFPAEAGTTYALQWDDFLYGTRAYTGTILVTAYQGSNGAMLFNAGNGYFSPRTLSVSSNDTIYVRIAAYTVVSTSPWGTYRIRYYDPAAVPPPYGPLISRWVPDYTIRWDPTDVAVTYQVSRSNNEAGPYTDVGSPVAHDGSSFYSFTDTGASPGTPYWYKVRAVNTFGAGPDSARALEVFPSTPLSGNTWAEGEHTASKADDWYSFPAEAGVTYTLQLDSLEDGTGAYTGRVVRLIAIQGSSNGSYLVSVAATNGYSSPPTLSVGSNDTIYVRVIGNSGKFGAYAVRYYR